MKVKDILIEDRYHDKWAKEKAAENRAKMKDVKAAEKAAAKALKDTLNPKEPRVKKEKPDLWKIWHAVETAIGNSFPDGDPVDHLPRNIDMDLVDKAVKLHAGRGKGKSKYGMYDYLADLWSDTQGDSLYDAKEMLKRKDWRLFDNSPFYHVENAPEYKADHKTWDGWDKVKIVASRNPWK